MGLVTGITLPNDGDRIKVENYNDPISKIIAQVNGNLDSTNISSLNGSKIVPGTLPQTALDSTNFTGWATLANTPNTVTCNGNRSYNIVFNGVDLTGILSPGMRTRFTRTSAAPTQCTDLESSSSQYYNKTSPAGMTFTDDATAMAWIKLESYPAAQMIFSRYNGTSGFWFGLEADGRFQFIGFNGGSSNFRGGRSYQSIPLGKWVHVAATLDMSGQTHALYIDGVSVPVEARTGGTNPTALIQAGNFEVGSTNGGATQNFDGKIAQAALFSAVVSASTIRSYISQGLSGSEPQLISAYSFNNSINDLNTSNANNLTPNNSALATNADSPFSVNSFGTAAGDKDYGIITKAVFSTNTTLTVQVPEGNTIPTSGGVSAVAYSVQKAPYGMPISKVRWDLESLLKTNNSISSNANYGNFISGGFALTVNIGSWNIGYDVPTSGTPNNVTVYFSISPTSLVGVAVGSEDVNFTSLGAQSDSTFSARNFVTVRNAVEVAAQSTYVMYTRGATTLASIDGAAAKCRLVAEFALL